MNPKSSLKHLWRDRYTRNEAYFLRGPELEEEFKDWDSDTMPEISVELKLDRGLWVLCSDAPTAVADRFFEAGLVIADRIIREDKLRSSKCKNRWPGNQAQLLRAMAHIRFLRDGRLDVDLLCRSAQAYRDAFPSRRREWDDHAQNDALNSLRLSLLAGDREKAQELLDHPWGYRFFPDEPKALRSFMAGDSKLGERFFEKVRNPEVKFRGYYDDEMSRIDWAILLAGPQATPEQVVEMISH